MSPFERSSNGVFGFWGLIKTNLRHWETCLGLFWRRPARISNLALEPYLGALHTSVNVNYEPNMTYGIVNNMLCKISLVVLYDIDL